MMIYTKLVFIQNYFKSPYQDCFICKISWFNSSGTFVNDFLSPLKE